MHGLTNKGVGPSLVSGSDVGSLATQVWRSSILPWHRSHLRVCNTVLRLVKVRVTSVEICHLLDACRQSPKFKSRETRLSRKVMSSIWMSVHELVSRRECEKPHERLHDRRVEVCFEDSRSSAATALSCALALAAPQLELE